MAVKAHDLTELSHEELDAQFQSLIGEVNRRIGEADKTKAENTAMVKDLAKMLGVEAVSVPVVPEEEHSNGVAPPRARRGRPSKSDGGWTNKDGVVELLRRHGTLDKVELYNKFPTELGKEIGKGDEKKGQQSIYTSAIMPLKNDGTIRAVLKEGSQRDKSYELTAVGKKLAQRNAAAHGVK